ncbi:hypothetical protein ACFLZ5_06675 [Thermodesulfobacteriota bacterium]
MQKKKQEKGTRLSRPPAADTLRFSLLSGRKKTRLRLKQFLRLFPPTAVMLSAKEWARKKTSTGFIAISRSRAAELEEEKRFGGVKRHSEEPSFNEQHRGVTRRETK